MTWAWIAAAALAAATGSPVVVDRIVAVVGTEPIAASAVAFEAELAARITGPECAADFGRLLCADGDPLEALVFRTVLEQAGVSREIEIRAEAGRHRLDALRRTFGSREGLDEFKARWRMTEQDLTDLFQTTALLDQAIDVTVGRLVRDISEEEQRRYHEEHREARFGGQPFEAVAAAVSAEYYALKFERTFGAWASELRAAARVRLIGR